MHVALNNITKIFGKVRANDAISLDLYGGRVYAVLGENGAGKSTLMKILSGYQPCDSGHILLDGKPASFRTPADALAVGIGMLHQDPLDVPNMTVLENFVLSAKSGLIPNQKKALDDLSRVANILGFTVRPDAYIDQLTIGERQQLEIIRLLSRGAQILILDEPTTGISADQKDTLFNALRALAHDQGMTICLVSHKLEDVEALCDEVYVLREGKVTGHTPAPFSTSSLVEMMFGKPLERTERQPFQRNNPLKNVVLSVKALGVEGRRVSLKEVYLDVEAGEVIGLAGLDGSGQVAFLRAIAGLQHPNFGFIYLQGGDVTRWPYHRLTRLGVAYAPAGRLEEGLVQGLSLTEHFALVGQSGGLVNWNAARKQAEQSIVHYNIRGRPDTQVQRLSGGNQQRTLLALLPESIKLLLLENPTRGLDVESSCWMWSQLLERRSTGTAILFTSPDLDEIIEYSDRIAVFFNGRMTLINDPSKVSHHQLGQLIGGKAL